MIFKYIFFYCYLYFLLKHLILHKWNCNLCNKKQRKLNSEMKKITIFQIGSVFKISCEPFKEVIFTNKILTNTMMSIHHINKITL